MANYCVYLRSFHQMALPVNGSTHLIPAYYSFYRSRKDERLSWPSWLTYSGWLTHIRGHPSAAGRAQDRESSPARDRRSTTVPCHQLRPRGTSNITASLSLDWGQPLESTRHTGNYFVPISIRPIFIFCCRSCQIT